MIVIFDDFFTSYSFYYEATRCVDAIGRRGKTILLSCLILLSLLHVDVSRCRCRIEVQQATQNNVLFEIRSSFIRRFQLPFSIVCVVREVMDFRVRNDGPISSSTTKSSSPLWRIKSDFPVNFVIYDHVHSSNRAE